MISSFYIPSPICELSYSFFCLTLLMLLLLEFRSPSIFVVVIIVVITLLISLFSNRVFLCFMFVWINTFYPTVVSFFVDALHLLHVFLQHCFSRVLTSRLVPLSLKIVLWVRMVSFMFCHGYWLGLVLRFRSILLKHNSLCIQLIESAVLQSRLTFVTKVRHSWNIKDSNSVRQQHLISVRINSSCSTKCDAWPAITLIVVYL